MRSPRGPLRARRAARWVARAVGVAVLVWLWPASLGGRASFAVVHGHSMEPRFHSGDLVIAQRQADYAVGDIVVFRARFTTGGAVAGLVVHRIVEIRADGTIVTQGDHRATADHFPLQEADVVGRVRARVPRASTLLWLLSRWWVLAPMTGLVTALTLWPQHQRPDGDGDEPAPGGAEP